MMEARANYSIVGVFVITLGTAFVVFTLWLSAGMPNRDYSTYEVYFQESVAGLTTDAPVKYNGVPVGSVKIIALDPHNPQRVQIVLAIQRGTPILTSTKATLKLQGITGLVYISLTTEDPHAPLLATEKNNRYPRIQSDPSLLVRLDSVLSEFTGNLSKIGDSIEEIFNDENSESLSKSLEDLSTFAAMLSQKTKSLSETVDYARLTLENTSKASEGFPSTIKRIEQATDAIQSLADRLRQSSGEVDATMQSGRVMVEALSDQLVPEGVQTLAQMRDLTKNLTDILQELQTNPSMLVRGKKTPQKGPGE